MKQKLQVLKRKLSVINLVGEIFIKDTNGLIFFKG